MCHHKCERCDATCDEIDVFHIAFTIAGMRTEHIMCDDCISQYGHSIAMRSMEVLNDLECDGVEEEVVAECDDPEDDEDPMPVVSNPLHTAITAENPLNHK